MAKKNAMQHQQLSLFECIPDTPEEAIAPTPASAAPGHDFDSEQWRRYQKNIMHLKESDMEAMRAWLLAWGKRHDYPAFSFPFAPEHDRTDRRYGLFYGGEARWTSDLQPPHSQAEWYPGEWLVKAIEHCMRFDNHELSIPWQVSKMQLEHNEKE